MATENVQLVDYLDAEEMPYLYITVTTTTGEDGTIKKGPPKIPWAAKRLAERALQVAYTFTCEDLYDADHPRASPLAKLGRDHPEIFKEMRDACSPGSYNTLVHGCHSTDGETHLAILDDDTSPDTVLPEIEAFKLKHPYYLSRTKRKPHFLCTLPGHGAIPSFARKPLPKYGGKIEILANSMVYAPLDAVVTNPTEDLLELTNEVTGLGAAGASTSGASQQRPQPLLATPVTPTAPLEVNPTAHLVRPVLEMTGVDRAMEYNSWLRGGYAIKGAGGTVEEWVWWSQRCAAHATEPEARIQDVWLGFPADIRSNLTTLKDWAREDSPEDFAAWEEEQDGTTPRVGTYEEVKAHHELTCYKVQDTDVRYHEWTPAKLHDRPLAEAKDMFQDVVYMGADGKVKDDFYSRWLKDPSKRVYRGVGCFLPPDVAPEGFKNDFIGLQVDRLCAQYPDVQAEDTDIALLLSYIKEDVSCANDEKYIYIMRFLAQLILFPGRIPRKALLLCSPIGGWGRAPSSSCLKDSRGTRMWCRLQI